MPVLPPATAARVLGDLTHLMRSQAQAQAAAASSKVTGKRDGSGSGGGGSGERVGEALPAATQTNILQNGRTAQELLRHFWVLPDIP